MPLDPASGVYYEVVGKGPPVLVGLPLMASHADIFGPEGQACHDGYVNGLADRFSLILMDYPSIGRSRDIPPHALTAERVCDDLVSVAASVGHDRFAWLGYSWSGAVGLQLAARTRLTALAIGGWPPLDAPYPAILRASRARIGAVPASAMRILRGPGQYAQWSAFYDSVSAWPEADAVAAIDCPRLVFFGGNGDLVEAGESVPIASAIRGRRSALEAGGWRVVEFAGQGHAVCMEPSLVVPVIRDFLLAAHGLGA